MTPNWVLRDSALSTNEFLVYQALLSRADVRREAWPSMRLLASDSRLSEATVKRTLPLLGAIDVSDEVVKVTERTLLPLDLECLLIVDLL